MNYNSEVTQIIVNMLMQSAQLCVDMLKACLPVLAPVLAAYFGIYFAFKLIPMIFGVKDSSLVGSLIPDTDELETIDTETGEIINWEELENAPVDNDIYWQYEEEDDFD